MDNILKNVEELWPTSNLESSPNTCGHMINMILVFLLASVILLIAIFTCAKSSATKSQESEWGDSTGRELMKTEKERENARRIEETGYSERDEREHEEDSDDSDDGE